MDNRIVHNVRKNGRMKLVQSDGGRGHLPCLFDGAKDLKHIFVDAHYDKEDKEEKGKFVISLESLYISMVTGLPWSQAFQGHRPSMIEGLPTRNVTMTLESQSQHLKNKVAEKEQDRVEKTIQTILGYKHEVEEKKADARKSLLEIADYLDDVNKKSNMGKAGRSGVGTVGGVFSLTGLALTASGAGAEFGVPLMAAGNLFLSQFLLMFKLSPDRRRYGSCGCWRKRRRRNREIHEDKRREEERRCRVGGI